LLNKQIHQRKPYSNTGSRRYVVLISLASAPGDR